jgi:anti-sigma factor RsiW
VKGFGAEAAYLQVGREVIPNPVPSNPRQEAPAMTPRTHPDDETLAQFVLGRLDRKSMARVEGHLRGCSRCGQVAMQTPDDRLVALLKASTPRLATEAPADDTAGLPRFEAQGPFRESSSSKSPGKLRTLVVLACLAGVMCWSVSGCSGGGENSSLSPEAQAKAKENFKKRFGGSGEKTKDSKTSR